MQRIGHGQHDLAELSQLSNNHLPINKIISLKEESFLELIRKQEFQGQDNQGCSSANYSTCALSTDLTLSVIEVIMHCQFSALKQKS